MGISQELSTDALSDLLFDEPGVGRCLVAPDGRVVRVNAEWLRATGRTPDQLLGTGVLDLFPEARDAMQALHARARQGLRVPLPRRMRHVDGRETWWDGSVAPVGMRSGVGLLLTATEVAATRLAAPAPTHGPSRNLLLEAIVRADLCMAIMSGPELHYTLVNPAYESILPGTPMRGRRMRDVFPNAAAGGLEAIFLKVMQTGEPWRFEEYTAPTADLGATRTWDGEALRLPTGPGESPSIVVFAREVTERTRLKQALVERETELEQANLRLQTMIDSITDGLLVLDRAWRCMFVSERAAQIIGMRPEHLLGGRVWELFPHVKGTRFQSGYLEAMHTQQPVHFEEYYPAPLDKWLECHCYPSPDALTMYFRDVTQRKRADESLRESTALLRAISDGSQDVIFAKDRTGRLLFVNPAALRLIGKPAAEVVGRTDLEILDDKEAARQVMANDARIMSGGVAAELEEHVPLPDGTDRIWLSRKAPLEDEAGRVVGLLGISRDITDRKATEDKVRKAHQRIQRILSSISDGLAVLDRDWRYTFFSETGARMLGVDAGAIVGTRIWDAFPHVRNSPFERELRLAVDTGQPRHFEEFYPEPLNMWVECHCYPSLEGLSVYFRDVTARHRAEDALRESDRRKSEFIAVLSHELRNPLAPIVNSLRLLERGGLDNARAPRAVEVIGRQTQHLVRLVDDLLDLTRIERGRIELERQRMDLRDIVRRTTDDLHDLFARARIQLDVTHPPAPLWVDVDGARMAQVLGNLLHNAVKFTDAGGNVHVTLAAPGRNAQLRVTDSGVGLDAASLEHIFEPFVQAEQTLARTKGGLGLGLALVKALVEMQGGRVQAHSGGPGQGAEFSIELPLAEPTAEPLADPAAAVAQPPVALHILVIEDNADAADTLAELLALEGHVVRTVATGGAGVAAATANVPHVVLCDLGLPDMDGFEVARTLRAEPATRHLRLVALTGYARPEDQARAREAGFDLHLAKPPDFAALQAVLAECRPGPS